MSSRFRLFHHFSKKNKTVTDPTDCISNIEDRLHSTMSSSSSENLTRAKERYLAKRHSDEREKRRENRRYKRKWWQDGIWWLITYVFAFSVVDVITVAVDRAILLSILETFPNAGSTSAMSSVPFSQLAHSTAIDPLVLNLRLNLETEYQRLIYQCVKSLVLLVFVIGYGFRSVFSRRIWT